MHTMLLVQKEFKDSKFRSQDRALRTCSSRTLDPDPFTISPFRRPTQPIRSPANFKIILKIVCAEVGWGSGMVKVQEAKNVEEAVALIREDTLKELSVSPRPAPSCL